MWRLFILIVVAILLQGCYSIPHWTASPQASGRNFKEDDYDCIRETSQRGAGGFGLAGAAAIRGANNESKRL